MTGVTLAFHFTHNKVKLKSLSINSNMITTNYLQDTKQLILKKESVNYTMP